MHRWFAGKNKALVEKNQIAIHAGWQFCAETDFPQIQKIPRNDHDESVILSGNQALVLGAIAAGCRYFAGYPITPASNILEHMVAELPKFGGIGLQTEDEIAALGACIGASYAGTKAMTATSGPGLSLMHEMIGMASMMEIPVVIVDAQRAGPSTGMPTKMEQSDLLAAIHGSHGDVPRVVLAPGSVEECYAVTIQAFNISEFLRLPVIVLTDLALAQRTATLPIALFDHVEIKSRRLVKREDDDFAAYSLNDVPVNPMAVPGTEKRMHVVSGLEHDEHGMPNYTPDIHAAMTQKRFAKLEHVFELYAGYEEFQSPNQEVGIIGWGSNLGPILESVMKMDEFLLPFPFLHLKILHPLPKRAIQRFAEKVNHIVVVENNYQGQLASLLTSILNIPVTKITKVDGLPFSAKELFEQLRPYLQYEEVMV
jgi:2-oxoglutarate ferredoxin oxidoreductase subunit alpha